MLATRSHFSLLSHAWLVAGVSLGALVFLGVLLWSPWDRSSDTGSRPLLFYCAAGMTKPVAEIIDTYQQQFGVPVQATYDGSGKLLSTISASGGRGDLYLAADASHMAKAQEMGLVAEAMPVAVIRPVLIINHRTYETLQKLNEPLKSANDLLRDDLKVVLANPDLASIGQMTRDLLRPTGVWAKLEEGMHDRSARVSTVGTVQEVAQIVRTRDGYVGVVWDAVARQQPDLVIVAAPEFEGASERVMIGVLKKSEQPNSALEFARYLTAPDKGQEVFSKYHFAPVGGREQRRESRE